MMINQAPVEIARLRLASQHLTHTPFRSPAALLNHMGGIQAQDLPMSKWAIGIRIPGITEAEVENAMNQGEILRTHVMRPTWHWVSAENIHWMLDLTRVHLQRQSGSWNAALGLSPDILTRSIDILLAAISENEYQTRDELVSCLQAANIDTSANRVSHILMEAEFEKLICSGPILKNKQTYALFSDRAGKNPRISREEALAKLAGMYFSSHGPATLADFVWWSGLPVTDARKGLESIQNTLGTCQFNQENYWFTEENIPAVIPKSDHFFLPAFDEYIISYKSKHIVIPDHHLRKAVSDNGIFRPVIIKDGQVTGLWRKVKTKNKTEIDISLFTENKKQETQIRKCFQFDLAFWGQSLIL